VVKRSKYNCKVLKEMIDGVEVAFVLLGFEVSREKSADFLRFVVYSDNEVLVEMHLKRGRNRLYSIHNFYYVYGISLSCDFWDRDFIGDCLSDFYDFMKISDNKFSYYVASDYLNGYCASYDCACRFLEFVKERVFRELSD
jgi:hypothetical protein